MGTEEQLYNKEIASTTEVVSIPYNMKDEKFEINIYKEEDGYEYEVKERKGTGWKTLKSKEEKNEYISVQQEKINEKDFNTMISKILDYYVGNPRVHIPEQAKEAYKKLYQNSINTQKKIAEKNIYECLKETNTSIDMISDDSLQKYVSKKTPIAEGYIPQDLTKLESKYYSKENAYTLQLREEASKQLQELAKAFTEEFEGDQIEIYSAYRNKERQQELWEENINTTTVAEPRTSEHELGLAIDIRIKKKSKRKIAIDKENIYFNRLKNNAHEYGFHNSYQKGKEIDNIEKEGWHRRYLGKELATILEKNKISFTEYYTINTDLEANGDKDE